MPKKSKPTAAFIVRRHQTVIRDNREMEPFGHYQPHRTVGRVEAVAETHHNQSPLRWVSRCSTHPTSLDVEIRGMRQ